MSYYGPVAIVDLIAADLAAQPTLPTPNAPPRRYAEPTTSPAPDACPFLAIWTETTSYQLLTGAQGLEAYNRRHNLTVGWYVYDPGAADFGGTGDPATVQDLETVADALDAILTSYASGIPGTSHQVVATIDASRLEPVAGTIWRAAFALTVEQAS